MELCQEFHSKSAKKMFFSSSYFKHIELIFFPSFVVSMLITKKITLIYDKSKFNYNKTKIHILLLFYPKFNNNPK